MKPLFRLRCAVALLAAVCAASCSYHREELMEQAAGGDIAAQYELGRRLLTGQKGFNADPQLALAWLKQAALQGSPQAMAAAGLCYERGLGTEASDEEAERWYNRALEEGNLNACVPLMRLAAKRGDSAALAHVLTPLAERGAAPAQLLLSSLYLNDASPQKQELGIRYLRFAAMQGNAEACLRMGLCYAAGKGVPQNAALARGWFANAKNAGNGEATAFLKHLEEES